MAAMDIISGIRDQELCALFDKETGHGQDMAKYDDLLGKSVKSIAGTFKKF